MSVILNQSCECLEQTRGKKKPENEIRSRIAVPNLITSRFEVVSLDSPVFFADGFPETNLFRSGDRSNESW